MASICLVCILGAATCLQPFIQHAQADVKGGSWPLGKAREFVMNRHVSQPADADIPEDRVAFADWLRRIDPYAAIEPRREAGGKSLGLLKLEDSENKLVVPLVGGSAWDSGLRSAVQIIDPGELEHGSVVGNQLDNGQMINQKIDRKVHRPGSIDFVYLANLPTLRITGFVSGRTVRSARFRFNWLASLPAIAKNQLSGGLVLDLRYCGGGDVYEATDFGGLWLDDRVNWVSINGVGQSDLPLQTGGQGAIAPMINAILVSRFTASACEQLVLGLKTYLQVPIAGENTAGKCSVQTTIPLGSSFQMRISTGHWSGPEGMDCDESGVVPDAPFKGNIHNNQEVESWLSQALPEQGVLR
jgi:carboxyl-terminal processing protease